MKSKADVDKLRVAAGEGPKHERPTICQLCGKSDNKVVEMFVGGYVNWAHKECAEIGERVIRLWREHQKKKLIGRILRLVKRELPKGHKVE